jgi:hypothetical protein
MGIDIVRDVDNNQTIYLSQKLYTELYVSSNVSDLTPIKLIPIPEIVDYLMVFFHQFWIRLANLDTWRIGPDQIYLLL